MPNINAQQSSGDVVRVSREKSGSATSNGLADYKILKQVGKGAFGTAYLAKDGSGSQCVIKQVDISRMTEKEKQESIDEVRMLSRVASHPFIVRYREAFLSDKNLCIVMDYCGGGELWNQVRKRAMANEPFPESQIRTWFMQMVVGIHFLHRDLKTMHRDLKTNNVFLDSKGRARIGDFGLAKVLSATLAKAQTFCGTPAYMAPEVMKERPYSWAADVWSLGVVMYELVALDMPFKGNNMMVLAQRICENRMPPIPKIYSQELTKLIQSMLEKTPENRPTIDELLKNPIVQAELTQYCKSGKQ